MVTTCGTTVRNFVRSKAKTAHKRHHAKRRLQGIFGHAQLIDIAIVSAQPSIE